MIWDRGIGFGLGGSTYSGGLIRNNMVHTTRDVGIGLESAAGAVVVHNSLYAGNYFNSIEYRFAATSGGTIAHNLANAAISARDGGTADLFGNYSAATAGIFLNPTQVDLHLSGPLSAVVDQAAQNGRSPGRLRLPGATHRPCSRHRRRRIFHSTLILQRVAE